MSLSHVEKVRLLYKSILRLHRGLPPELQILGNEYVKDEFKKHKQCSPVEANLFMSEWANYAISLTEQLGIRGKSSKTVGVALEKETLENFKDDQLMQLYLLMQAAKGLEDDEINRNLENLRLENDKK